MGVSASVVCKLYAARGAWQLARLIEFGDFEGNNRFAPRCCSFLQARFGAWRQNPQIQPRKFLHHPCGSRYLLSSLELRGWLTRLVTVATMLAELRQLCHKVHFLPSPINRFVRLTCFNAFRSKL